MSKNILFAISSPIVRPNGIVTFITESASVLQKMGYTVDLITDNEPTINLKKWFEGIYYPKDELVYPSKVTHDGKPIINYIPHIQNRIRDVYNEHLFEKKYDVIIGNDVQSTSAFLDLQNRVRLLHYIHSGGLVDKNTSFLTDHYLNLERQILDYCEVAGPHEIMLKNVGVEGHVIHLPLEAHEKFLLKKDEKQSGLTFVGEGTARKGADRFEQVATSLNVESKIVASSLLDVKFDSIIEKEIKSFGPHQLEQKAEFIRKGKVGYHPANCETWAYAVMEMLLSKPVVLENTYKWTQPHPELGATVIAPDAIEDKIKEMLEDDYEYDNQLVLDYLHAAPITWRKFLTKK